MATEKLNRFWIIATGILILIIIISSCLIWVRHSSGRPLVISITTSPPVSGQVYIDGAIANPGTYPLQAGDSIDSLIQASGGLSEDADLSHVQLHIASPGNDNSAQKVDINHAEAWLLQALPGIGEVRAKAIIDYRRQTGCFQNIEQLTAVPGINEAIFEKIKPFITVNK